MVLQVPLFQKLFYLLCNIRFSRFTFFKFTINVTKILCKISFGIKIRFPAKSIECKRWVSKYVAKQFMWMEGPGKSIEKNLNTKVYTNKLNLISSKISQHNVDINSHVAS